MAHLPHMPQGFQGTPDVIAERWLRIFESVGYRVVKQIKGKVHHFAAAAVIPVTVDQRDIGSEDRRGIRKVDHHSVSYIRTRNILSHTADKGIVKTCDSGGIAQNPQIIIKLACGMPPIGRSFLACPVTLDIVKETVNGHCR